MYVGMNDLQGKEPWNKGQNLNSDTCQRMSAAHQGRAVPRHVCAKMSKAHMGLRPSEVSQLGLNLSITAPCSGFQQLVQQLHPVCNEYSIGSLAPQ